MLVYCGQMVGWIKVELGMEVGFGPGHIVLDGDPAPPPQKGHSPPIFSPYLLWPNGCMDKDATWYGGRPQPGHIVLDTNPPPKGAQPPTSIFGSCLLSPNGCMDQDATWYEDRSRSMPHCVRWGLVPPGKGHSSPLFFGLCLLWPNGCPPQLLLNCCHCKF